MKKALALLISVIMIFGALGVTAAAATYTYSISARYATSNDIVTGTDYIIPADVTMTVPTNLTLYIPSGASLTVQPGGVLTVYGTIVVLDGGRLKVDGVINYGANVHTEGSGAVATCAVNIPAIRNYMAESVTYTPSVMATYYGDSSGVPTTTNVTAGVTVYAQLGTELSVAVSIAEAQYDSTAVKVFVDGAAIDNIQGKCSFNVTGTHAVTFTKVQNNSEIYRNCVIYLPTGSGYEIVGRNGEMSEDGTVKVKYGTTFSFRLVVDDTYDRSDTTVYCYDGYGYLNLDTSEGYLANKEPITPDADGYYTVFVDGDKTIQVEGVVSNEMLGKVTGIMDVLRNIIDMITSFFKQIAEALGIGV